MPYEIDEALSRLKRANQQTLTERFKLLPTDKRLLQRLCDEFIVDRDRQLTDSLVGFKSLQEWKSQDVVFEKLVLSKQFMSPDEFVQLDVWSNGGYWYGLTKEGVYHLVEKVDEVSRIEMGMVNTIRVGDYSDTYEVVAGQDLEGDFITFGGFMVRLGENARITLNFDGDFHARLKDALLARAIATHGTIWIEDKPVFQNVKFKALTLDELDRRIESLERVVHLLDLLAVKVELNPSDMSDYEFGELGKLRAALVDGKEVPLSVPGDDLVNLNIEFGKGRIKVIAMRTDAGNYQFYDPLGTGYVCALTEHPMDDFNAVVPLPTFFMLNREDFHRVINLDAQKLIQALDETPIAEGNSAPACNKLLDMLNAYDDGAVCGNELLKCCLVVAECLLKIDEASEVYRINYAQVCKRMGDLSMCIEDDLRDIALHTERADSRASAHILLGDRCMAEKCIEDFSEEMLREFERWPIANLIDLPRSKTMLAGNAGKGKIELLEKRGS